MLNLIDTYFSDLTDPRTGRNIRYPLDEILLVAVTSLMGGGQGYDNMADTGRPKRDLLEMFFPFKNGIPSDDAFRIREGHGSKNLATLPGACASKSPDNPKSPWLNAPQLTANSARLRNG